jgi:tetratricopeptide (TPR) repeat protein
MIRIPGIDAFTWPGRSCRRVRGLIAASLYNDLSQNELQTLESHLGSCGACRKQAAELTKLAAVFPVTEPGLDQDLWPAIRRAVRHESERHYSPLRLSWGVSCALGLCLIAATVMTYGVYRTYDTGATVIAGAGVPLENDLAAVSAMIDDRDYVRAYRRLEKAIQANPGSPLAPEAHVQLADLAYSKLNWYPEAYEAYDRLIREYSDAGALTECISRHELLDEARTLDYAPLYALDAARRAGDNSFGRLESVVAKYPGTLVASLAAEDMARQFIEQGTVPAGEEHVAAMERAKAKCTNPVAIARLKLEIGHIYMRELNDTAKARSFYAEVANFDDKTLASLAEGSLAALEEPAAPGAE